jgi:hypothetical protein
MGARNQVGIGLSYRPTSLRSLATQFQTRFLESIPRPIAGLKIPTLIKILVARLIHILPSVLSSLSSAQFDAGKSGGYKEISSIFADQ